MNQIRSNGLDVVVEWNKFFVGTSIYIPTLDFELVLNAVKEAAEERGMVVWGKATIHANTMGVRIWRKA